MAITVLISPNIRRSVAVNITTPHYRPVYFEKYQQQKEPLNSISVTAPAEVNNIFTTTNETITATTSNIVFLLQIAAFHQKQSSETVTVSISNLTLTLQAVSNLPI
jgi:hypothetical protein